ncbi:MAG TPA: phosphohistidine phosphatase SixA [Candidatus Paceibacterota bacterium]|nr:phosphohistidine phosphatase SixA [Candidatus Paceibacterota bacterium]
MKLYILRHGEAAEHGDPRFKENERPLTPKGIQRIKQLAHSLREMEISFDKILSSPLVRAKQTADIVARGMTKPVDTTDALTPSGSMKNLIEQVAMIRPVPRGVLLVGHEPYLSGLVSFLCLGTADLPVKLKKGALCRLEVEHLICGKCATLEWLAQPRLFG